MALENSLPFPKALPREVLRRYFLTAAVVNPAVNGDDEGLCTDPIRLAKEFLNGCLRWSTFNGAAVPQRPGRRTMTVTFFQR